MFVLKRAADRIAAALEVEGEVHSRFLHTVSISPHGAARIGEHPEAHPEKRARSRVPSHVAWLDIHSRRELRGVLLRAVSV